VTIRALLVLALSSLFVPGISHAHESRPGYLELREISEARYDVLWKQPARGEMVLRLNPVLPASCVQLGQGNQERAGGALMTRSAIECEGGLKGTTVRIAGLEATLTDVLIRVYHLDGSSETHLLRPISTSATISGSSAWERAVSYLQLGVQHILMGVDHLLFVLGLLLIVRGYASAPLPPLNAAIALSILFLGPEIVRAWRGETSFTIRHPWVVAFAFGLLHGFGFASGLTAMGLPSGEIPLALLLFNVGVELGQIGFVVLVILLERSFHVLEIVWPKWVEMLPGYAVGTLGAFWTIQRTGMLLGGLTW
jgi:hypothetical protein